MDTQEHKTTTDLETPKKWTWIDEFKFRFFQYKIPRALLNFYRWGPKKWLWWKAYNWVFSKNCDIRYQTVRDRLHREWYAGWKKGIEYARLYNDSILQLKDENARLKKQLEKKEDL